jgi:predicted GNAT family acetyltransferase
MATNSTPAATVRRNDAAARYEIELDGQVAGFIDFRDQGGALRLVHTEVEPAHEGKGLAAQLVQQALDDVRRSGRTIVPSCSYVARFIERHPTYGDLVAS